MTAGSPTLEWAASGFFPDSVRNMTPFALSSGRGRHGGTILWGNKVDGRIHWENCEECYGVGIPLSQLCAAVPFGSRSSGSRTDDQGRAQAPRRPAKRSGF